jgi:hypothetical protein
LEIYYLLLLVVDVVSSVVGEAMFPIHLSPVAVIPTQAVDIGGIVVIGVVITSSDLCLDIVDTVVVQLVFSFIICNTKTINNIANRIKLIIASIILFLLLQNKIELVQTI